MGTPTTVGRYEIIEELGRGAMGIVYRAKDPAIDRVVALKTIISAALASPQGAEFRERFYREARTAGGLTHPGIVSMFDVGEHQGMPYLVMEFVSGKTLAESSRAGERLSVDRVCEFGGQIADALAFAHHHGVVHRDIKPANILLTSGGFSVQRTKITDFGVAKLAEGQTTLTGQMLGTPAFMPPEQFIGGPIDGRSDIFSLGVVLYWMVTGERPFPGESISSVSYKVVHTDPIPPSKLNPLLPPRLENVILRCLAKNPDSRFQSGHELAGELSEIKRDKSGLQQASMPSVAVSSTLETTRMDTASFATPTGSFNPGASVETVHTTQAPAPVVAPSAKRRGKGGLILAGIALVALAAGGGYALRSWNKPAIESAPPVGETPGVTPTPVKAAPDAGTAKSNPVTPSPAPPLPAPSPDSAKTVDPANPNADPSTTKPSALGFDPKTLDKRQNARLEIDASRIPPDLEFTVEMNGKVYVRKTGAGPYKENDDLYLPPGVHEFRVSARSGDVGKVSNTVSTEFKANKRSTLRIELRVDGKPSNAATRGLGPGSQIIASLR
jgi:serine/threonine-protein kinase